MPIKVPAHFSPLYGIPFDSVPSRGGLYRKLDAIYDAIEYGHILDLVIAEGRVALADGDASPESTIAQLCSENGWRILPKHRELAAASLTRAGLETMCARLTDSHDGTKLQTKGLTGNSAGREATAPIDGNITAEQCIERLAAEGWRYTHTDDGWLHFSRDKTRL